MVKPAPKLRGFGSGEFTPCFEGLPIVACNFCLFLC